MKTHLKTTRRTLIRQLALLPFAPLALPSFASSPNAVKPTKSALIPVMITPFKADKSIDWNTFDRVTDFYLAAGADGYFANCLSSEMYLLTPEERLAVTERVIRRLRRPLPVVSTGSFGDTPQEKAEFIKKLNGLGTEAVILITGHLAEREESDDVLIKNVDQILALTGSIPLGTYESPNPYKRVLSKKVIDHLVKTKRFIYHKDTSESMDSIQLKLSASKGSKLKLFNAHTASAVASLRAGGAGLSPISANFYPEILNWICDHANYPEKKKEVDWIQKEIAETEPLISKGYPLSSKYFLMKRGLPIEQVTRVNRRPLTTEIQATLDGVHNRFLTWCERLAIQPVKL